MLVYEAIQKYDAEWESTDDVIHLRRLGGLLIELRRYRGLIDIIQVNPDLSVPEMNMLRSIHDRADASIREAGVELDEFEWFKEIWAICDEEDDRTSEEKDCTHCCSTHFRTLSQEIAIREANLDIIRRIESLSEIHRVRQMDPDCEGLETLAELKDLFEALISGGVEMSPEAFKPDDSNFFIRERNDVLVELDALRDLESHYRLWRRGYMTLDHQEAIRTIESRLCKWGIDLVEFRLMELHE